MTNSDLRRVFALALAAVAATAPALAQVEGAPAAATGAAAPVEIPTPPVAPALSPEAAAFRAELERAAAGMAEADRTAVLDFYAARGYAPFWAEPARIEALAETLAGAGAQGLPTARYRIAETPAGAPAAEVAAMRSWLAFGGDLAAGALTPSRVDPEIQVAPRRPPPAALLAALAGGDPAAAAAGLAPGGADYAALLVEKARLEAGAAADFGPEAPAGPTLRLGDRGERVAALRARLAARGHPAAGVPADASVFDAGLETALAGFQAEQGLEADGLAGRRTVAALNAGPADALKAVLVNLERARWTNGAFEDRYLYVNIPDYSLRLVDGGAAVFETRVVVGRAEDTRTPEFAGTVSYLVANPTWHIPDSIAQRVYLPKLKANPNTLANSNMRIFTRSGTEIDPGLVDFTQFTQGNFPFRIKQNPSDANALGKVKFMFPNQFSIYLHDTPHRELFARTERAFSNGCVRVQDPDRLAELLLAGQVPDPAAAFDGWVAAGSERNVNLARPIAVHIDYRTVFLDGSGQLQRRFDVYGRDAEVWNALEAAGVTLPAAQG